MAENKATIAVYRIKDEGHPYPWRFKVTYNGKTHTFAGLPNQCATRRAASMRARWRARWLEDGSFKRRYA